MNSIANIFNALVAVARSLDPTALVMLVALLICVRAFTRTVDSGQVEFWHFYASHAVRADGSIVYYGDPEKLGILIGIIASTLFMGFVLYFQAVNNWYVVVMFAIWLLFISGSTVFSKWGRGFLDKWAKYKGAPDLPDPPGSTKIEASVTATQIPAPPAATNPRKGKDK